MTPRAGPSFTVLGASGYIGSRLAARLQALGHGVGTPGRNASELFSRPLGHVVYCIGLTADFRTRPFDTVDAHVSLLADVLRRAQFESLLYLSSTRVYMGAAATHEDAPLTVWPSDPSYLYNLSKLTGESLCHASGRAGVRVARLSNVVGPGMDACSGNFVAALVQEARSGKILLRSDRESAKDYLHVEDAADWLIRIALAGRAATYNVASGLQTRHVQWAQWLMDRTGCGLEVQSEAPLHAWPPIDIGRLAAEFNVAPRSIFDEGILNRES